MKRIYFLLLVQSLLFNVASSFGQGGTWTWISGDTIQNSPPVYGTQGVPSIYNHPPGVYEACEWKDKQGNFWLYGGVFLNFKDTNVADITVTYGDLWKYNPLTLEWTWVNGNGSINQSPIYGTQGVPASSNTPGARAWGTPTWVDTAGNLWLFGGSGYPPDSYGADMNDMWEYNISTNMWTWLNGDTIAWSFGSYGTQGVPSPSNVPISRNETSSAWTDSLNNLWLFSGSSLYGWFDDLCKYDIATNEWTWMKGPPTRSGYTVYGTKGVANANNDPGGRWTYTKWKDLQGNFWLMGGLNPVYQGLNDVWKYDESINEWTWMYGPPIEESKGSYESTCIFNSSNMPYSRIEHRSSVTDNCGRFWLFGGTFVDTNYQNYNFNDLMLFDPQLLNWEWLSGTNNFDQAGNYGALGVASPSNMPSARSGAVAWWGNDNKFYLFGGYSWQLGEGDSTLNYLSDLWVFNPDTNCIPSCNSLASFQSSQTTICANACINFTNFSTKATSWRWYFAGASDSISTAENPQNVCYSKAGIYNVTLIASNAAGGDTVTFSNYITVTPAPPTPVITQHLDHDTLYCSLDTSYYAYQWFYDSTLIAGAIDTFLVISKSGNYNVQVTNKNGCSIAGGINIIYGIQNYTNDKMISIYPNPATDELLINGNWKENSNLKLAVINILGQKIYTEEMDSKPLTVNCKPFPTGIYFVQVVNESGQWVGKFIKE